MKDQKAEIILITEEKNNEKEDTDKEHEIEPEVMNLLIYLIYSITCSAYSP